MNQDTSPKPESSKDNDNEGLCEPCAGIQRNWRGTKGHPELVQGSNRSVAHRHGSVIHTKYRCERCGTVWEYENNKVNRQAGWSIVKRGG